jgi:SagB-type dehydrogenase family enzyme
VNKIDKEFINGTRYPDYSTVDIVIRFKEPPHELSVKVNQIVINLPNPKKIKLPDLPVRNAIEKWEPVGFFSRSSMTMKELSYLLWFTQGFKRMVAETIQLRNVPSSGSRYPLETYFVANEVEGLETGLYRYLPKSGSIVAERIDSCLILEMSTTSMNFKLMTRAAVTFLWVAVPYRSVWALGNRGYRSVLLRPGTAARTSSWHRPVSGTRSFPRTCSTTT